MTTTAAAGRWCASWTTEVGNDDDGTGPLGNRDIGGQSLAGYELIR